MNKIFLFYWYISDSWNIIYDYHLQNLKYYIKKYGFDEKIFIIAYDKNVNQNLFVKTINCLRECIPDAKFMFYDNDPDLRESYYFYNEIAMKLDRFKPNDVIFFAHNKGKYTYYDRDVDIWVNLLYYGNLNDPQKIENFLANNNQICFGTFTKQNETIIRLFGSIYAPFLTQRYKWHYSGTFFWFKPYLLHQEIKNNSLTMEENSRYFTEKFLGHLIPFDEKKAVFNLGTTDGILSNYITSFPKEEYDKFVKISNLITYEVQKIRQITT